MARPRTPNDKARVTGASDKNPKRFKLRKTPTTLLPLGNHPGFFDETQMRAWESFKAELPWLHESDRALMEMASFLRAKFWDDPAEFSISNLNQLRMIIGMMGGSPADVTKVYRPDDEADQDPSEAYFN